jgi:hypothetical protein
VHWRVDIPSVHGTIRLCIRFFYTFVEKRAFRQNSTLKKMAHRLDAPFDFCRINLSVERSVGPQVFHGPQHVFCGGFASFSYCP